MKHLRHILFGLAALLILIPATAFADIGPKPSVTVELKNLPEEPCYVTLLSRTESTGPYSVSDDPIHADSWLVEGDPEEGGKAWQAFRDYRDPDGYYFIEYFRKCTEDEPFVWSYCPPEDFKVLVYLPESGKFLSSEAAERYAFDSYFAAAVRRSGGAKVLTLQKNYPYGWELLSMAARIASTILLEMLIALLFGLWNRRLLTGIFAVNVVTQCILNVLLNIFNYRGGSWAFVFHYIWMEVLIVLLEWAVYRYWFHKNGVEKRWVPVTYSIVANSFSFACGFFLARLIPGIF